MVLDKAFIVAACSPDTSRAADDVSGGRLPVPSSAVDVQVAAELVLVAADDSATGAAGVPPAVLSPALMMSSDTLQYCKNFSDR